MRLQGLAEVLLAIWRHADVAGRARDEYDVLVEPVVLLRGLRRSPQLLVPAVLTSNRRDPPFRSR